jgi:hypothetical protein
MQNNYRRSKVREITTRKLQRSIREQEEEELTGVSAAAAEQ